METTFPLEGTWFLKEKNPSLSIEQELAAPSMPGGELFLEKLRENWLTLDHQSLQPPTCVQAILLALGAIPDFRKGFNEHRIQWIGEKEWLFKIDFKLGSSHSQEESNPVKDLRADLIFEGLDTVCDVYINATRVLQTDNMFTPYTITLPPEMFLRSTQTVLLHFLSALKVAKQLEATQGGPRRGGSCNLGDPSRLYLRKAQYCWRWDWGPEIMTVGPWKPILLRMFPPSLGRIKNFHPCATLDPNSQEPHLDISLEIEGGPFLIDRSEGKERKWEVGITLHSRDGKETLLDLRVPVQADKADIVQKGEAGLLSIFHGPVKRASKWWPVGYGSQSLYTVTVDLYLAGTPKRLSSSTATIGFRSISLVQEPLPKPDAYGTGTTFYFSVNGVPIYMGGSNWVPADSLLTEVSEGRYRNLLTLLRDGGQNMVRIWGGGIYEPDAFYDICDELGLLVWQDFQFACGVYPAHDSFVKSVRIEAEENVRRLRTHPCLALWCGNNEDYQQVLQWGGIDSLPARIIYESVLPEVIKHLGADGIPYWPGSPYGGKGWDTSDPTIGDVHQWNIWAGKGVQYQSYDTMGGRFVSEFGMPSIPDVRTVNYWMQDLPSSLNASRQRYFGSPIMAQHNRAGSHQARFGTLLAENFRQNGDFESNIFLTQVLQSESVGYAYRSWKREWRGDGKRFNGGTLVWQSNDCWPVASWAIIDYFLRPKPIYYAIKRELASITVGVSRTVKQNRVDDRPRQFYEFGAFQSRTATIVIWGTNSTLSAQELTLDTQYYDLLSNWRSHEEQAITLLPNQTTELLSKLCPHRGLLDKDIACPSSSVIVHARLIEPSSKKVVARYSDWPQPFRYIDFPDPELRITRLSGIGKASQIEVSVKQPAKCVVLSIREDVLEGSYKADDKWGESVKWEDNALDLFPDDRRVIKCPGLSKDMEIWAAYMGQEKAFKIV